MVALMGWLFRILFAFLNDPDVKIFGFKICAVHRKHIHRMVPELDGLGYHEQYKYVLSTENTFTEWYPGLMDSGIMNSTRAHQARVLNGQNFFFFKIKLSMSLGHVGLKNMVLELTKLEYHKKW